VNRTALNTSRSEVSPPYQENEALQFLDAFEQTLSLNREDRKSQEIDEAVCGMSIAMSLVHYWKTIPAPDALYYLYGVFRGFVSPPENTFDPQAWRRDASRDYRNPLQVSNVKQLSVTTTKLVCLSHDDVEPGDWLCLLEGVQGFWVLREVEDGCYRLISVTNVFGVDEGSEIDVPIEIIIIV
jgi:hypothetical protein